LIILSWNVKYHLYYIYFEIPKDLPLVFSWNLKHVNFLKNSHTLYNKLLFRLYASMNYVTSQFAITPFSAQTLTHAYATSQSSPRHTDQHHTFYNRRGCSWFSYLRNTYNAFVSLWMVSVECFTSSRLSWAPDELGLPHETPLTVIFASCGCTIKFRTRISWNFYASFFHHMNCAMNRHWE
jgi:hypothetical protein